MFSPAFKAFRWDLKQACAKAREDVNLGHDETDLEKAARLAAEEKAQKAKIHAPATDESKPYPHKNANWNIPKDGKVRVLRRRLLLERADVAR